MASINEENNNFSKAVKTEDSTIDHNISIQHYLEKVKLEEHSNIYFHTLRLECPSFVVPYLFCLTFLIHTLLVVPARERCATFMCGVCVEYCCCFWSMACWKMLISA